VSAKPGSLAAADGAAPEPSLAAIVATARDSLALLTDRPVDQVVSCARAGEHWQVLLDIVEAPARLGDNDLLATYRVSLTAAGEVSEIARIRRYNREDKAGGPQ